MDRLIAIGLEQRRTHKIRESIETLNQTIGLALPRSRVVEIVAYVAANIFTNYFSHVAATVIDFPVVRPAKTA